MAPVVNAEFCDDFWQCFQFVYEFADAPASLILHTDGFLNSFQFIFSLFVSAYLFIVTSQVIFLVLRDISFEADRIIFSGLPATDDPVAVKTFTDICAMMNRQALAQNRIQAKQVNGENEKYAMRIWLVRLGMNGAECKDDRKFLMENLSGHSAFRTDEERSRWLEKQEQKRQKLNAIKAAMGRNDAVSE